MAKNGPPGGGWRERWFGSLLGQLRMAAFASVFIGFTTASVATLLINQRALIHQHERRVHQTSEILRSQLALLASRDSPERRAKAIEELGRYSSFNLIFWIRLADNTLLVPEKLEDPRALPLAQAAEAALIRPGSSLTDGRIPLPAPMAHSLRRDQANPLRRDSYRVVQREGRGYLTHLHLIGPRGTSLWVAEDISANIDFLTSLLRWLLLAWSICLTLTLLAIWLMTRRIIQPLQKLNILAGSITCASLATSRLDQIQAPLEVRQLANGYNTLLDRMSLAWENQREFVSAVSHELRNPLTIISGYLQRLQRQGTAFDPEQRRSLVKAEAETRRMSRMLHDLLDLSRSDSGRLQLVLKPVAVDQVLLTTCDLARSQLSRPLELQLPPSAGQRTVDALAEADRLQQVLLNLIENADKYSAPAQPIQVILEEGDGKDREDLRITVVDRGIGIPPDDLPRIFDRFHRGANAAAQIQGSGLGLSVVKRLVEAMGGTIQVESQLGRGSRFQIHLPPLPKDLRHPGLVQSSTDPWPFTS
jgi:two-component system OmpR family sensor kinase